MHTFEIKGLDGRQCKMASQHVKTTFAQYHPTTSCQKDKK
jgi:hypothetical protein